MEPKRMSEVVLPFPCPVMLSSMKKMSDTIHFCSQCNKQVHDLTSASDKDFTDLQLQAGSDFCAVYDAADINLQQTISVQDRNISLSRFLYALILVFGTSLFSSAYADDLQSLNTIRENAIHTSMNEDSVGIFFRVSSDSDVVDNRQVIIYDDGKVFATRTVVNGYFELSLPAESKSHTFTFLISGYAWDDKKIRIKVKNGTVRKNTYDLFFKKVNMVRLTGRFL